MFFWLIFRIFILRFKMFPILFFISDNSVVLLTDDTISLRLNFQNILNAFLPMRILKKPNIVVKTFINQTIISFEEMSLFISIIANDSVEKSIVWVWWRCLFLSHDSSQPLKHLLARTLLNVNFNGNICIG